MQKTSGYKGMLRDRIPQSVNYALKWRKAKERWIEHAYQNFIKFYCNKQDKDLAARITLGIAKNYREFEFDKSIEWDNLTPKEEKYWKIVSSYVEWFDSKYNEVKKLYEISRKNGKDEFDIKIEIINRYLSELLPDETESEENKEAKYKYVDDFVDFLIKCFNNRI